MSARRSPSDSRQRILRGAVELVLKRKSLAQLSGRSLALYLQISSGLIYHYFGTIRNLKSQVVHLAVIEKNITLLAYCLTDDLTLTKKIPKQLKEKAIARLFK